MHKAYFDPVNAESHDVLSLWLGWTLVSNETSLYSQQINGTENIIVKSLSRYFHMSDQTLTNISNQIFPPQTAAYFHVKQPPRNVISWILSLAAASTQPTAFPKPLQPISLATGIGCSNSSHIQTSKTNSWGGFHNKIKNPRVIICCFSEKKPVRHNQETNTLPRNCQILHIGYICVLPYAPLEQPDPRVLRPKIPIITETTQGIQNYGPNNETSKSYSSTSTSKETPI